MNSVVPLPVERAKLMLNVPAISDATLTAVAIVLIDKALSIQDPVATGVLVLAAIAVLLFEHHLKNQHQ